MADKGKKQNISSKIKILIKLKIAQGRKLIGLLSSSTKWTISPVVGSNEEVGVTTIAEEMGKEERVGACPTEGSAQGGEVCTSWTEDEEGLAWEALSALEACIERQQN